MEKMGLNKKKTPSGANFKKIEVKTLYKNLTNLDNNSKKLGAYLPTVLK